MKKTLRSAMSALLAAMTAALMLTAQSSAAKICVGGNCFNITLPDCNTAGCGTPVLKWITVNGCKYLQITQNCPTNTDCTDGNCTNSKTDCKDGNCSSTGNTVTTPAEKPAASSVTAASEEKEVLTLVNKRRAENGLSALTLDSDLNKLALIRAKEIVRSFSHTRPDGTSNFTVFKENGMTYRYAGENLAYGQKTAESVMNAWMNSSGHRANILGRNFSKIGIACYTSGNTKYWVQIFTD